ncbi:Trm112 family protein [Tessaracoccus caeni]|uniref:Trm112 family protein n=1 Tax=Tessaracoccus caeni TaxID=3031239 RepID=UPI0023DBE48C|nr:Trm112 family protein [Tessaracoccus caeni]MDF1488931.1 Trm112 family protein [Tessaracoccus caeni]
MADTEMDLSPELLALLACPSCHAKFAVDYDTSELICTSQICGLAYPVRDNIPVLLIDQARSTL